MIVERKHWAVSWGRDWLRQDGWCLYVGIGRVPYPADGELRFHRSIDVHITSRGRISVHSSKRQPRLPAEDSERLREIRKLLARWQSGSETGTR